jgi:membrane protein required for beta-lactamase induction
MTQRLSSVQLEKYEAWIRELESRQRDIASHRPGYLRLFVGIVVVSVLGFVWDVWFGVGSLVVGILMCAFGFYTVLFRQGEYTRELEDLRRTADDLRAADSTEGRARNCTLH